MILWTRNQSIMLFLPSNQSANHAILTFQPSPSIPLLQQSIFSVPYLDAYSSICFPVMDGARIRGFVVVAAVAVLSLMLFLAFLLAPSGLGQLKSCSSKLNCSVGAAQ